MARAGEGAGTARARRRPGPRAGQVAALGGTRDDLLRAGSEVFAERGFDGATAELIAERAGTTKAMINYHFRSKQGLYDAILVAMFTELARRLDEVRAAGRPATGQLHDFVAAFAQAAADLPTFPAIMIREALTGGAHLPEPAALRIAGVVGVVRGMVEQGVQEGAFRKVDPLLTHIGFVGSLLFFFATAPFRKLAFARIKAGSRSRLEEPTTEAFVVHMQELMVRGLRGEAAPRRRK
jgi:TetR/AcrR family transcriptional regulator